MKTRSKLLIIFACVALYVIVIMFQSFNTIFIDGDNYRKKVQKLKIDSVSIPQMRGFIFADNYELLAGSLPEYNLAFDFKSTTKPDRRGKVNIPDSVIALYFGPNGEGSKALAKYGNGKSAAQYGEEVRRAYKRREGNHLILRNVPYLKYKELRTMPYFDKTRYKNGLIPTERAHRYRPYGEHRMASITIGDVYADQDKGQIKPKSGIEFSYDSLLRGKPGLGFKQKIRGRNLEVTQIAPENGANVHTTLNVEMQDILDRALNDNILKWHASCGWAAVMEVSTGKIKAISNLRREGDICVEDYNHLFRDRVDPGSTFKTVSYMVLLDKGKITPDTLINTGNTKEHPGTFNCHGKQIRDDHPVGIVTADEAICQSSNIAVAKMTTRAFEKNPQEYLDAIEEIGFFTDMHLNREIPGAANARRRKVGDQTWSKVSLGQISYGYETEIPGIYMLNFYNAIANDGKLMRPYIVEYVEKDGKKIYEAEPQVINKKICKSSTLKAVRHALEGVVDHGTASVNSFSKCAHSDKVKIAGKTGTAQRYENGRFANTGHNVSFVGYFPADNPQYSCIVVMQMIPPYYGFGRPGGGFLAGPVFRTFAEETFALHGKRTIKDIQPDTLHNFAPAVKGGIAKSVNKVLKDLDFDTDNLARNNQYASVKMIDNGKGKQPTYEIDPININQGLVPNVVGMGASDALFLLEDLGLNVSIVGQGRVVAQSLPSGTRITKGNYIKLTLK